MAKYFWLINIDRCIGCETCVIACKQENNTLSGVNYRHVQLINPEQYPGFPVLRISLSCNHCEKPACLKACPVKAYTQIDGIVQHDPEKCIGCKYCTWVCPYDAPRFAEAKGKVEKCGLCLQRLKKGLEPACVAACPTSALKLVQNLKECTSTLYTENLFTTLPGLSNDKTGPKLRLSSKRFFGKSIER